MENRKIRQNEDITIGKSVLLKGWVAARRGSKTHLRLQNHYFCENFALLQNFLSAVAWGWGGGRSIVHGRGGRAAYIGGGGRL